MTGYRVPADYRLVRVTSHRARDRLKSALGPDFYSLMACPAGWSGLKHTEVVPVRQDRLPSLRAEVRSPTPAVRAALVVQPWTFGGDYDRARAWLEARGFVRDVLDVPDSTPSDTI